MNRRIYTAASLLTAAAMVFTFSGCGCGKKNSADAETVTAVTDMDSIDYQIWSDNTCQQLLDLIREGMADGWTTCSPEAVGLGSFAEDEGTEIGYLFTDLDGNGSDELILAKRDAEEDWRVCAIWSPDGQGGLTTVYSGGDQSEMQILKKNVLLVTSMEEADTDTADADSAAESGGESLLDAAGLTEEDYETIAGMTEAQSASMAEYLMANDGMTEAEAESAIGIFTGQDNARSYSYEEVSHMVSVVAEAYRAETADGDFESDYTPEEETADAAVSGQDDGTAERLAAGAWIYKNGAVSETDIPSKIQEQELDFLPVAE